MTTILSKVPVVVVVGLFALGQASAFVPSSPNNNAAFTTTIIGRHQPTKASPTTKTCLFEIMDASNLNAAPKRPQNSWDRSTTEQIQGLTLKTWSLPSKKESDRERVQVLMKTNGRPMHATIDLMQGPNYTPQSVSAYLENGNEYELNVVMELASPQPYTLEVRNTAEVEFPLQACVQMNSPENNNNELGQSGRDIIAANQLEPIIIQGGSLRTFQFDPLVDRVQVYLQSDGGRPFWCKVELLEGPNNIKEVVEVYTKDGVEAPFFITLDTPGNGYVARIINTGPLEYPLQAALTPLMQSGTPYY